MMELACGGKMMDLGVKISHDQKPHKFGMAIGMSLGIIHDMKDRKVGMNPGVGRQTNSKMRTPVEQLMVFMLNPLISDMFANFATGLTLEIDSSSSCEDNCSQFSTDEIVCCVSISGLQCLESIRLFCTCGMEGASCFGHCPHCTDRPKVAQTLWHLTL